MKFRLMVMSPLAIMVTKRESMCCKKERFSVKRPIKSIIDEFVRKQSGQINCSHSNLPFGLTKRCKCYVVHLMPSHTTTTYYFHSANFSGITIKFENYTCLENLRFYLYLREKVVAHTL